MPRVKRGVTKHRRHKEFRSMTKGQWGTRHRLLKRAKDAIIHSLDYAYRHRRERKADMRRLWIQRINAAARQGGVPYGRFMEGLKKAHIGLDRKTLADVAVRDPKTFAKLVEAAKAAVSQG